MSNTSDVYLIQGSEDIDLSAYTGQTVVIAFKYTSNSTDGAAAWTVDSFNVQ